MKKTQHFIQNIVKLIVLMVLVFTSNLEAKQLSTKDFSIELPDNWVQIPDEIIHDYSKFINKKAPRLLFSNFDYAFQKDNNDFINYPNFLVKIKNKGKMTRSEFKAWVDFTLQDDVALHQKELNKVTKNQIIDKIFYDATHNLIWFEVAFNNSDNDIRAISFMLQTEKGIMQLYGNCLKNNYQEFKPVFWQIAKSIQLSNELEYDDNILKKKSTYVMAVAFLIVYFIVLMTIKAIKLRIKK